MAIEYVRDSISSGQPLDEALIRLRVEDNGVGLPPGITPGETKSLGLKVVQLLSRQLRAQIVFRSTEGFQAGLTFMPQPMLHMGSSDAMADKVIQQRHLS